MKKIEIKKGDIYGYLSINKEIDNIGKYRYVECQCECGNIKNIRFTHLRNGSIKSCGCKKSLMIKNSKTTHDKSKSSEWGIWNGMKQRCSNPNADNYSYYGGRGIKVCDRWFNSFENFLDDIGQRPSMKHSIDRINNDGNYEPSNCRWATKSEQRKNQRHDIQRINRCFS